MPRAYSKRDTQIRVRAGDRFSIVLDANPTTGYEWHAAVDGDAVALQDASLTPGTGALGAAGAQRFEFEAKHAGRVHVSLTLSRSWEPSPIETVQSVIEVAE